MAQTEPNPFEVGDLFLRHYLPGDAPAVVRLRGWIYRLNVAHKNKRMVPSILLLGEPGVGKGYTANLIAAHLWWLRTSLGEEVAPQIEDIYLLASRAGLRTQTLTALPPQLAEATLFGARKGAYTDLKADRLGVFDSATQRGRGAPDPFDVFLDEIGDAPVETQGKLLEIFETGTFRPLGADFAEEPRRTDARIIAATNRDLAQLVKENSFRVDLYDRLSWVQIELPAVRDQFDQLPVLMRRINASLKEKYSLGDAFPAADELEWARTYAWPGNYRELTQVLWHWHLFDGTLHLGEIVESRLRKTSYSAGALEAGVLAQVSSTLDAIRSGKRPGYQTYGEFVEEFRQYAYGAIYQYNRQHQLKDNDLRCLFSGQDPLNVRKQISENRPKSRRVGGEVND